MAEFNHRSEGLYATRKNRKNCRRCYIFGATEAEVKHLAVGDIITVTTDDRNQVVRVVNNGRTVRDGVPAEFQ